MITLKTSLHTTLKHNLTLGILMAVVGFGASPAIAQQGGAIPILPGIEDLAIPEDEPAQEIVPLETAAPDNVVVEQLPIVIDNAAEVGAVPPPQEVLAVPQAVPSPTEVSSIDQALEAANNNDLDENLFYDADALVPQGEFVENTGTIKVNPRTQPASRFVVVNKGSSANSTKARLVSASRAAKLGRHDSALAIYEALYEYNKNDPQILMGRALSLQHLGRIDEALMAYNDFLDRRPKDINARVNMLGLMVQKYPSVALRHLLELHETNQDNVGVIAQIAVTYAQMGKTEEALKYFGVAAGMQPKNAGHLYNMAIALDQAGDKISAVSLYEKALETDAMNGSGSVPREVIYERLAQLR